MRDTLERTRRLRPCEEGRCNRVTGLFVGVEGFPGVYRYTLLGLIPGRTGSEMDLNREVGGSIELYFLSLKTLFSLI